jgi:hypothetical protein
MVGIIVGYPILNIDSEATVSMAEIIAYKFLKQILHLSVQTILRTLIFRLSLYLG